ncbi:MAG: zinc-binding alcohol dehydrogenase [Clostridiales bacterium]|nr:zinc-binding alcohol dehydrogenase [Clostridiales bacterium]
MTTKRIIFTAPGVAECVPGTLRDELRPGEVLTGTEFSAVSAGTEYDNLMNRPNVPQGYPKQLGYSACAKVLAAADDVKGYRPGDRVLVYHGTHSANCIVSVGSDHTMLTPVLEGIDPLDASFVVIASMGVGGMRKLALEPGESCMIMGLGLLGIFALQFARLSGACPLIAADPKPERREKALEFGADYALDPAGPDFAEKVKSLTGGKGVNGIVEVTGVSAAMHSALDCAARMGRIALLGCTRVSEGSIDYYQQVHRPGVRLIGAHNFIRPKHDSYPRHWTHQDDCTAIMRLILGGRMAIRPIISEVRPPEDAPDVYRRLAERTLPLGVAFDWTK